MGNTSKSTSVNSPAVNSVCCANQWLKVVRNSLTPYAEHRESSSPSSVFFTAGLQYKHPIGVLSIRAMLTLWLAVKSYPRLSLFLCMTHSYEMLIAPTMTACGSLVFFCHPSTDVFMFEFAHKMDGIRMTGVLAEISFLFSLSLSLSLSLPLSSTPQRSQQQWQRNTFFGCENDYCSRYAVFLIREL